MIEDCDTPQDWESLQLHSLCLLFPEMVDEEYLTLLDSMKLHGFFESDPIILIDISDEEDMGAFSQPEYQILDGRNRHLAAMDTGVEPIFVEFTGEDPLGFVTGRNLDRRHLNTGQKAAIASELAILYNGQNSSEGTMTQSEAADQVRVGEASIRRFKYVEKHNPELAADVKAGLIPLEAARTKVKEALEAPVEEPSPVDAEDDGSALVNTKDDDGFDSAVQELVGDLKEDKFMIAAKEFVLNNDLEQDTLLMIRSAIKIGYEIACGDVVTNYKDK